MEIKTEAFKELFHDYPNDYIEKLLEYHKKNGGISRYEKIKYFFIEILKEKEIDKSKINFYANQYSQITKNILSNPKLLINDTIKFIENNYHKYNFHIASGADEKDLKYICKKLKLEKYFLSIHGSPTNKKTIIEIIIKNNNYNKNETILIGDSINDLLAAKENHIEFFGYNNPHFQKQNIKYIESFKWQKI